MSRLRVASTHTGKSTSQRIGGDEAVRQQSGHLRNISERIDWNQEETLARIVFVIAVVERESRWVHIASGAGTNTICCVDCILCFKTPCDEYGYTRVTAFTFLEIRRSRGVPVL